MNFKQKIKYLYGYSPYAARIIRTLFNLLSDNRYRSYGRSNVVSKSNCFLQKTRIMISGSNNRLIFEEGTRLKNCVVFIYGDNNKILIERDCNLNSCTFWIEDNENVIIVGKQTTISGKTEIACIEGCNVTIGNDCMFSSDILIRTGDSHSIIDKDGKRINNSVDITIGNHVWIGTRSILNKGSTISDNSIVGAGAIVTKPFFEENCVLAGNPATIIRSNIDWLRERI